MAISRSTSLASNIPIKQNQRKNRATQKTRELANFFFTDHDRSIMGLAAIAGALAGALQARLEMPQIYGKSLTTLK